MSTLFLYIKYLTTELCESECLEIRVDFSYKNLLIPISTFKKMDKSFDKKFYSKLFCYVIKDSLKTYKTYVVLMTSVRILST